MQALQSFSPHLFKFTFICLHFWVQHPHLKIWSMTNAWNQVSTLFLFIFIWHITLGCTSKYIRKDVSLLMFHCNFNQAISIHTLHSIKLQLTALHKWPWKQMNNSKKSEQQLFSEKHVHKSIETHLQDCCLESLQRSWKIQGPSWIKNVHTMKAQPWVHGQKLRSKKEFTNWAAKAVWRRAEDWTC